MRWQLGSLGGCALAQVSLPHPSWRAGDDNQTVRGYLDHAMAVADASSRQVSGRVPAWDLLLLEA